MKSTAARNGIDVSVSTETSPEVFWLTYMANAPLRKLKKAFVSEKNRKARFRFAKEHLNCMINVWSAF